MTPSLHSRLSTSRTLRNDSGDIQLFQLRVNAAHANAAAIAVGGVQGIDDLEADQTGTQAETAQQLADLFVADAFVSKNVLFPGRVCLGRAQPGSRVAGCTCECSFSWTNPKFGCLTY
ncbi:hypothetical protein PPS11_27236 [Pseudomonas putida S11]|nr:hypothetical protein PPS11_27236 [Pseudomonas putida S11]